MTGVWVHNDRMSRPWVAPVIGAVIFVLTLGMAGTIAGDYVQRESEMRDVVTQIEASEHAMDDLDAAVKAAAAPYDGEEALTDAERAGLNAALQDAATAGLAQIAAAGEALAEVPVLPWHERILAARDAYLAHNHAWQDYLAAVEVDPSQIAMPQPAVIDTWAIAQRIVPSGVPRPDAFGLRARLEALFASEPDPASAA
jgi:hypothetical protein